MWIRFLCWFISVGEAKLKRNDRRQLLQDDARCIYCGAAATTIDHCPARSFFERKQWPGSYEFPACEPCNSSARKAEQALSVLVRATRDEPEDSEWEKLFRGLANNLPEIIREWTSQSRNEERHAMRATFGRNEGDQLRRAGYGMISTGPLTSDFLNIYMIKLSKALYYKHNGKILDGTVYINHISTVSKDTTPELLNILLSIAPILPEIKRNNKSGLDQFIYRVYSEPSGILYVVVQFTQQYIFQLIALSPERDARLTALMQSKGIMPYAN